MFHIHEVFKNELVFIAHSSLAKKKSFSQFSPGGYTPEKDGGLLKSLFFKSYLQNCFTQHVGFQC